jgi:hypothetical protein
MNRGILREKDANVRTEFLLDTHPNVAKKMFPGIVMHHRMSLLDRKHEEENMKLGRYPVGGLSDTSVRSIQGGTSPCRSCIRVVVGSMSISASSLPVSSELVRMANPPKRFSVLAQ